MGLDRQPRRLQQFDLGDVSHMKKSKQKRAPKHVDVYPVPKVYYRKARGKKSARLLIKCGDCAQKFEILLRPRGGRCGDRRSPGFNRELAQNSSATTERRPNFTAFWLSHRLPSRLESGNLGRQSLARRASASSSTGRRAISRLSRTLIRGNSAIISAALTATVQGSSFNTQTRPIPSRALSPGQTMSCFPAPRF